MKKPMTTNFRALGAKIVELWDADCDIDVEINELRELLATPPPEPPTDEKLLKLTEKVSTKHMYAHKSLPSNWDFGDYCSSPQGLIDFARAALERWGK